RAEKAIWRPGLEIAGPEKQFAEARFPKRNLGKEFRGAGFPFAALAEKFAEAGFPFWLCAKEICEHTERRRARKIWPERENFWRKRKNSLGSPRVFASDFLRFMLWVDSAGG